MTQKYGTLLIDPPWPYQAATENHRKLTGYSNYKYGPLSIETLAALPVGEIASDEAVLLLWATWPMMPSALDLVEAWGFDFVTGLPWVKVTDVETVEETSGIGDVGTLFKPFYGVGYWFRGCTEPLLVAKRPKAKSVRTPWVGLLCDRAQHSRKPDSVYELAEANGKDYKGFPKPRVEVFARRRREGWDQLGDAIDGRDIQEAMDDLRRGDGLETDRVAEAT